MCKNNESERARKAKPSVIVFKNFLSMLSLPINLNFVRARFEFDLSRLNVCVSSQNLQLLIITFLAALRTNTNKCTKELKRACMWSLLLSAIVAASSLWLLELQKLRKHKKNKLQTSVSSLFLIKRHPIKYMHIEKNLTKKTLLFPSSDVKRAYDLLRGRSLASRICVTSLNNGRKKTPSLIRVDVNQNFNLDMYLWIALLLWNKPLIWRPLGYYELSVPSFNMLFSLLTAADFLYHQFWEFVSWSRQSLPTHHNYVYFQHPSAW